MRISRLFPPVVLFCLFVLLSFAAVAPAAPITVQLRVEGSTKTLFEGPVATEGTTFEAPSSRGPHPCDYAGNGLAGGKFTNEGNPSGTPTTALRDAALASGLEFDAEWFGSGNEEDENPGDFFVSKVGPDANQVAPPFASWGYAVNYTTAPVGGCQIALAPGNEVLWAYNYFNLAHRLKLSGPASVEAGHPFAVHVSDGQSGEAQLGASIGEMSAGTTTTLPGSPSTAASGDATITLSQPGTFTLKATREDSVRSNGLTVCVHDGQDGSCGTTRPPVEAEPLPRPIDSAVVLGVHNGQVYARRAAPRVLRGTVTVPTGATLRGVRISLARKAGKRCFLFSGVRGTFVRSACGKTRFFSVGSSESFSYLLPARLPAGRYVYEVQAVEGSGRPTLPSTGVSRVVFRVR